MQPGSRETVQVEVPRSLFRAMHWRPLGLLVAALTGVSISFCPLFLYWFGRWGFEITDWRVLTNFALIYLVGSVYISFGAPVLNVAWKRPGDWASRPVSRRAKWLFFLVMVAIGLIIYVVSMHAIHLDESRRLQQLLK